MTELKQAQRNYTADMNQIRVDVAAIKADLKWLVDRLEELTSKLGSCPACSQSEYLVNQATRNRNKLDELVDDVKNIKYIAVAISFAISLIVSILALISILKGWIHP